MLTPITERLRTAEEAYKAEIADLNELLKQGAIARETFARQVAEFQEQLGIPPPPNPVRELMRDRGVRMDEVRAGARRARNGYS